MGSSGIRWLVAVSAGALLLASAAGATGATAALSGSGPGAPVDTKSTAAPLMQAMRSLAARRFSSATPAPNWTELSPATSPAAREASSMAYDPATDQMLLFGGSGPGDLGDTWIWSGTTWTQLSPATSPSARTWASMAYDPATEQMLLFGGNSANTLIGDTWAWNGTTWTELSPATSPAAREASSMAYDPATDQMLLFGGSGPGDLGDTWIWSGTTWTQLSPATSPSARTWASMAYDPATGQMLLFGGNSANTLIGDTWAWNGTTWTELSPATSPAAREASSMAYDPATDQMLLFGGSGPGDLGDTWIWSGTTWTQLSPATSPSARTWASMAYDPATEQMLLFGGNSANTLIGDTWSYQTPPTPIVSNTNDGGSGSLRDAIEYANANPGTTISFDIPVSDPGFNGQWFVIQPLTALPALTQSSTTIDGSTQTGNTNSSGPAIELDGRFTSGATGLTISSSNDVVRDLSIDRFQAPPPETPGGMQVNGSQTLVTQCFIGVTPAGVLAGNGNNGISFGSDSNQIVGNLIAGNSAVGIGNYSGNDNVIQGNRVEHNGLIGIDAGGDGTLIGGAGPGQGNLVSGNTNGGIGIEGSGVTVEGNLRSGRTQVGSPPRQTAGVASGFWETTARSAVPRRGRRTRSRSTAEPASISTAAQAMRSSTIGSSRTPAWASISAATE